MIYNFYKVIFIVNACGTIIPTPKRLTSYVVAESIKEAIDKLVDRFYNGVEKDADILSIERIEEYDCNIVI